MDFYTVFALDDDALFLRSLERNLRRPDRGKEFILTTATSLEQALPFVQAIEPDVILCDFRLGRGRTGVELLEQIPANWHGRFIFHTSVVPEAREACVKLGLAVPTMIGKPASPRELLNLFHVIIDGGKPDVA